VLCLAHPLLLSNRRHHGEYDKSSAIEPDGASAANFPREVIAMKREMKITVINHVTGPLTLYSEELTHGKWTDGAKPTPVIGPSGRGYVNSQKQTLASYGTEGNCQYIVADSSGTSSNELLKISWTKPYGHGDSKVTAAIVSPDSPYKATVENVSASTSTFEARVTVDAVGSEMKITVVNHVTGPLTLYSEELIHGRWTNGAKPTPAIEPSGRGYVNSQTGAAYGTEGNCQYIVADNGSTSSKELLKISWTKPSGHGDSKVTAAIVNPDSPYKATVENVSASTSTFAARVTVDRR
jgi:hypothetical protein